MTKSSPTYKDKYTPLFEKQLKKLKKKSPVRTRRIEGAIQEILNGPYQRIDFGKGLWQGKRKRRVGDDRITFVVCKQCRDLGHQMFNQCSDCDDTPDETVIFVSIIDSHKY